MDSVHPSSILQIQDMLLHIRVDIPGEHPFCSWIVEKCTRVLLAQENVDGKNIHVHIVADTDTPVQTIRNNLRKHGLVGNKSYSCKEVQDLVKMLAYVLKDGDIIENTFDDKIIEEAKAYDLKVKDEMKQKKSKNILEGIEASAVSRNKPLGLITIEEWSEIAVKYYKDNGLLFRSFQVVAQVQTLWLKHGEGAVWKMARIISDKCQ